LGVLIFVHEFGHFVTARRNGIKADEFGFGFPPRMFGFVKDERTGKYRFVPGNKEVRSKKYHLFHQLDPSGRLREDQGRGRGDRRTAIVCQQAGRGRGSKSWRRRFYELSAGVAF